MENPANAARTPRRDKAVKLAGTKLAEDRKQFIPELSASSLRAQIPRNQPPRGGEGTAQRGDGGQGAAKPPRAGAPWCAFVEPLVRAGP